MVVKTDTDKKKDTGTASDADIARAEGVDPTSEDYPGAHWRTGPNVDIGLEPGAVTVDPDTAQGVAARAARKNNGAKSKMNDDGVEVVDQPDAPYGPKVEEGEEPTVMAHQRGDLKA